MILRTPHTGPNIHIRAAWTNISLLFALPINFADLNDAFKF